jgi:hypothetical protein
MGSGGAQLSRSGAVERASHRQPAAVQHVSVDHGRLHVGVAEQLLNGPDVVAVLQEVGRERVPEGVARRRLREPGGSYRGTDRVLHRGFREVVPSHLSGARIDRQRAGGEYVLPSPAPSGRGVLPGIRTRKVHLSSSLPDVPVVAMPDTREVRVERRHELSREHRDAVFLALPLTDRDLVELEVEILHPQPQRLQQAQPGSVQKPGHQTMITAELRQNRLYLGPRQDHRHPPRTTRTHDLPERLQLHLENDPVQEEESRRWPGSEWTPQRGRG